MAAATSFIKDRPDGHAAAMGACYSSGKSKPSPSSSASMAAPQTRNSTPPTSGKVRRTQSLCSNSSQNAPPKNSSTGKGWSTSFGPHTHHGGSSLMHASNLTHAGNGDAHNKGEDCSQFLPTRINGSSVMISSSSEGRGDIAPIGNANDAMLPTSISDVGVALAATENSAAAHSTASSSSISSPRCMHRSASSKVSKPNTPRMQSTHIEMKSPSLKSGVGAYEVLTPRKLMAGIHGMPPSTLDNSLKRAATTGPKVTESPSKAESLPLVSKGSGVKELCKNCKTGNSESVCFIANDGRIASANTGPATVCHFHHCNSPRCAANPNYQSPSTLPCKKVLLAKPSLSRSHPDKAKVKAVKSRAADDCETCCSTTSFVHEGGTGNQNCQEEGPAHTLPTGSQPDSEGKLSDAADVCGTSAGSHGLCSVNVQEGATTSPQSCPSVKNDQRCASPMDAAVVPLHCNDDDFGFRNDLANTPLTTKDGVCKDLESKADLADLEAAKVSQARNLNMERMRQRYLDCLKEQEAETVRLKKQEMIARKQAGEWMLDSAIGEILQKLAPDGEAGVKVIVEAFETIMQQSDLESHHHDDASGSLDC